MIYIKNVQAKKIGVPENAHNSARLSSRITDPDTGNKIDYTYIISYTDEGTITLFDKDRRVITSAPLLRRIRSSAEYKAKIEKMSQDKYEAINGAVDFYRFIYYRSCPVLTRRQRDALPKAIVEMVYVPKQYPHPKPDIRKLRWDLQKQREREVSTIRFWRRDKLREQYVEDRLKRRYEDELAKWRHEKDLFDIYELSKVRQSIDELEEQKRQIMILLKDDRAAVDNAVDSWTKTLEFPFDFTFEYRMYGDMIAVDLHVPSLEAMPVSIAEVSATGIVKAKSRSERDRKSDYYRFCVGLMFFMASNLFDCAVGTDDIIVSVFAENPSEEEECLCSARFDREYLSKWSTDVNMDDALEKLEHRVKRRGDLTLKKVEPLVF
ncbi:MAG: hypothetical protein IJG64_00025 [Oscillospiraceae bacterium]|nr:hypothetical protein [Oscillospiraceae bacterium]